MKTRLTNSLVAIVAMTLLSGCLYQSIGKSTGGFVNPVAGPDFVHIDNDKWDRDSALVYFYRPHSQWASEEIESPSVYIDDRHYFNFRNNSFTWMEVAPGERHFSMRRPLLGLEGMGGFSLSMIANGSLELDPGGIYYLRYSEVSTPETSHPDLGPDHPLASGDLQLVTRELAMSPGELASTKFLNSDHLSPNHAATSIVVVNQDDDYDRDIARLEEEREVELEHLKADGKYEEASWYWPFGGGPTVSLEADKKIRKREWAYKKLERKREREAEEARRLEGGSWWWPF